MTTTRRPQLQISVSTERRSEEFPRLGYIPPTESVGSVPTPEAERERGGM